MYHIYFYVPATHLESVKQALFAKGAGKIGLYEHCAWQVIGEGQYRPLLGSKPLIGETNVLSREAEYRVEMVCAEADKSAVIAALLQAHPYETPAYGVLKLIL